MIVILDKLKTFENIYRRISRNPRYYIFPLPNPALHSQIWPIQEKGVKTGQVSGSHDTDTPVKALHTNTGTGQECYYRCDRTIH